MGQILLSALVLGLAFMVLNRRLDAILFGSAFATIGIGFIGHELAHKFMAVRFGYYASYQIWPMGLVLALASAFLGLLFAALGVVRIYGIGMTRSEEGVISLSGPTFNIGLAVAFMMLAKAIPGYSGLLGIGAYVNSFIALFNCLPLGILDGQKIFNWDKGIWLLAFVTSAALLAMNF